MSKSLLCLVLVTCSTVLTATAEASLVLGFSPLANVTSTTVNIGDSVAVPIYLVEDGADTRLFDSGLFGFSLEANYSIAGLQFQSISFNPAFDDFDHDASFAGRLLLSGLSTLPPTGQTNIQLATVSFLVTGPGVHTISLADPNPLVSGQDFVLNDGTIANGFDFSVIDAELFGPAYDQTFNLTVNVSAVPEPSSALSLLGSFVLFYSYKRRFGFRRRTITGETGR